MPGRIIKLTKNGIEKKVFKVSSLHYFIGSDEYCDLRIFNKDVSAQHCLITALKDKPALIRNLSREHPILVNEKEIGSKDVELKPNDIISINRDRYIWKYDSPSEENEEGDAGMAGPRPLEAVKRKSWPLYKNRLVAVVPPHRREKTENCEQPITKKKRKTWTGDPGEEVKETQPGVDKKPSRVIGLKTGVRSGSTVDQKRRSSEQRKSGAQSLLSKGKLGTPVPGGRKSVKFADTTPANRSSRMSLLQRSGLKKGISSATPYRGPRQTPKKKESVYFTPPSRSGGARLGEDTRPEDQLSSPPEVSIGTVRNSISIFRRKMVTPKVVSHAHRNCVSSSAPAVVSKTPRVSISTFGRRSSSGAALLRTPPRSAAPRVVMRSHRKCIPGGEAVSPPSTPKSTSKVSLKRRSEAASIEASRRAAKKLKAEPPHAIDEKKRAAILMCHRKSLTPHPGVPVRKPLFKEVMKRNLSSSFKKLKSPKKSTGSTPVSAPLPYTTTVPKKFDFQSKVEDSDEKPSKSESPRKISAQGQPSSTDRSMRRRSSSGRVLRGTVAELWRSETTARRGDHVDLLSALDLSRKTPSSSVSPNSDTTITDGIRQLFASDKTWDAKGVRELFLEADNNTPTGETARADESASVVVEETITAKSRRSSVLKGKRRTSSAEQSKGQSDSILSKSINSFYLEGVEPSPLPGVSAALISFQDSVVASVTSRRSVTLKVGNNSKNDLVTSTPLRTRSYPQLSEMGKVSDTKQKSISSYENSLESSFRSAESTIATSRSGRRSANTSSRSVSFLEVSRKSRNSQKSPEKEKISLSVKEREETTLSSSVLSTNEKSTDAAPRRRGRPSKQSRPSSAPNIKNESSYVGTLRTSLMSERSTASKPSSQLSKQRRSLSALNIRDIKNESNFAETTRTSLRSGRGSVAPNKSVSFAEISVSLNGVSRKSPKSAEKTQISYSVKGSEDTTFSSLHLSTIEKSTDAAPKPRGRPFKKNRSSSTPNIKNVENESSLRKGRGSALALDKSVSFAGIPRLGDVSRKSRNLLKLAEKGFTSSPLNNSSVSLHLSAIENISPKYGGRSSNVQNVMEVANPSAGVVDSGRTSSRNGRGSATAIDKSLCFVQLLNEESLSSISRKSPMSAKKKDLSTSLENTALSLHVPAVEECSDTPKVKGRRTKQTGSLSDPVVTEVANKSSSFLDKTKIGSFKTRRESMKTTKNADISVPLKKNEDTSVSSLHMSVIEKAENSSPNSPNTTRISSRSGRGLTAESSKKQSLLDISTRSRKSLKPVEKSLKSPLLHLSAIENTRNTPKPSKQRRSLSTPNIVETLNESSTFVGSTRSSLRSGQSSALVNRSMNFPNKSKKRFSCDSPSISGKSLRHREKANLEETSLSLHLSAIEKATGTPRSSKKATHSPVITLSIRDGIESKRPSVSFATDSGHSMKQTEKTDISLSPEYTSLSLHPSAVDTLKPMGRLSNQNKVSNTPNIKKNTANESSFVNFSRTRSGRGSSVIIGKSSTAENKDVSLSPEYTSLSVNLSAIDTPKSRGRHSKKNISSFSNDKSIIEESSLTDSTRITLRSGRSSMAKATNKDILGDMSMKSEKSRKSSEKTDIVLPPENTSWSLHLSALQTPKPRGRPPKQARSLSVPDIKEVVNESFQRILRSGRGSAVTIKRSVSFAESPKERSANREDTPGKMMNSAEIENISLPLHKIAEKVFSSTPIARNKSSVRSQGRNGTPDNLFSPSSLKLRGRTSKILKSVSVPDIQEVSNENISDTSLKRSSISSQKLLVEISSGEAENLPDVLSPVVPVMSDAELSSDNFKSDFSPRIMGRKKRSTSAPTNGKRKSSKFDSNESCKNVNHSRKNRKNVAKENRSVSFSSFPLIIGGNEKGGVSLQEVSPLEQKQTSIGKPTLTSTPYPTKRKQSKCNENLSPSVNKRQRKTQFLSVSDSQISEPSSGMSTPELLNSSQVIALSPKRKSLRQKVEQESESLLLSVDEDSSPLSILSPKVRPSLRNKMEQESAADREISHVSVASCSHPFVSVSRLPDNFLSSTRNSIKKLLDKCNAESIANLETSSGKVSLSYEKTQQISPATEHKAQTSFRVQEEHTSFSNEKNSSKLHSKTPFSTSRTNISKGRLSRSKESLGNRSISPKGKLSKSLPEDNITPKSAIASSESKLTISPRTFFGISPFQRKNNVEKEVFKTPNSVASSTYKVHSKSMNRRSRSFISAKTPMTFGDDETPKSILSTRSVSLTKSTKSLNQTSTSLRALRDPEKPEAAETPKSSVASRRGRPSKSSRPSENLSKSRTRVTSSKTSASDTPKIHLASSSMLNRRSKSFTSVNISPRSPNSSKIVASETNLIAVSFDEAKRKSATKENVRKRKSDENASFNICPQVKKKKIDLFSGHMESVSLVAEEVTNESSPAVAIVIEDKEEPVTAIKERGYRRGRSKNKTVTAEAIERAPTGEGSQQVSEVMTKAGEEVLARRIEAQVEQSNKELVSAGRSKRGKGQELGARVKPQTRAQKQDREAKEEVGEVPKHKARGRKARAEESEEELDNALKSTRTRNISKDIIGIDSKSGMKLKEEELPTGVEEDQKKKIVHSIPEVSSRKVGRRRYESVTQTTRRTRDRKAETEIEFAVVEVENIGDMSLPKKERKLKGKNNTSLPPPPVRATRSRVAKEVTLPLLGEKANEKERLAADSSKNTLSDQSAEKIKTRRGRNQVDVLVMQKETEDGPKSRGRGRVKKVEESITKEMPTKVEEVLSPPLKKTRGRKKQEDVELVKGKVPSKTGRQKVDESTSKEEEVPRVQRTRNGRVEKVKDQVSPKHSPLKSRSRRGLKNEPMMSVQSEKTDDTRKAVEEPALRSGRRKKVEETGSPRGVTDPVSNRKTRGRGKGELEKEEFSSGHGRRNVEPRIEEVQKKKRGKMEVTKYDEETQEMSALKKTRDRENGVAPEKELPSVRGRRKVEPRIEEVERAPVQKKQRGKTEVVKGEESQEMSALKKTKAQEKVVSEKEELPSRSGRRKMENPSAEISSVQRTKKGRVAKVKEALSSQQVKNTTGRKADKEKLPEKPTEGGANGRRNANKRKSILSVKLGKSSSVAKIIKARLSVRRSSVASLSSTRKRVDFNMKKIGTSRPTKKLCQ